MAVLVRRHNGERTQQRSRPVQRYQPLSDLEDIQEQTAQLLEQMMGVPADVVRAWVPDVDIEETDKDWILEAEIPGARAEDVHVEAEDNELTIRGAIAERERQGVLRRRTRRVGDFEYQVTLPGLSGDVEPKARLHHGVLEVRVPKPEQSRPRQIEIREEESDASGSGSASTTSDGS